MSEELTYWEKRALEVKQAAEERTDVFAKQSSQRLEELTAELEAELDRFIKRYAVADPDNSLTKEEATKLLRGAELHEWRYTLSEWERMARSGGYEVQLDKEYARSRVARLRLLEEQLRLIVGGYAETEQLELFNLLMDNYADTYYRTVYDLADQTGQVSSTYAYVDPNKVDAVLRQPWAGSSFSSRTWGAFTQQLPSELTQALLRGIALGYNSEKLAKQWRTRYQQFEQYQWRRIIRTEMARAFEQASYEAYKEAKVEQYRYLATLEARTCDHCGSLDLEVFDLKDKRDGINYPPLHPFCRCTTVAYFGEELTERWSKDPLTGRRKWVDGSMSYEEWRGKMTPEQAGAMVAVKNRQQDKKQYEPLRKYLPENYRSIAKFQELKYNKSEQFADVLREAKFRRYAQTKDWTDHVKVGDQRKHFNEVITTKKGKKVNYYVEGKSYFAEGTTIADIEQFLNKYAGTGELYYVPDNNQYREVVSDTNFTGYYVNDKIEMPLATDKFKIHYNTKGQAHIVPSKP